MIELEKIKYKSRRYHTAGVNDEEGLAYDYEVDFAVVIHATADKEYFLCAPICPSSFAINQMTYEGKGEVSCFWIHKNMVI